MAWRGWLCCSAPRPDDDREPHAIAGAHGGSPLARKSAAAPADARVPMSLAQLSRRAPLDAPAAHGADHNERSVQAGTPLSSDAAAAAAMVMNAQLPPSPSAGDRAPVGQPAEVAATARVLHPDGTTTATASCKMPRSSAPLNDSVSSAGVGASDSGPLNVVGAGAPDVATVPNRKTHPTLDLAALASRSKRAAGDNAESSPSQQLLGGWRGKLLRRGGGGAAVTAAVEAAGLGVSGGGGSASDSVVMRSNAAGPVMALAVSLSACGPAHNSSQHGSEASSWSRAGSGGTLLNASLRRVSSTFGGASIMHRSASAPHTYAGEGGMMMAAAVAKAAAAPAPGDKQDGSNSAEACARQFAQAFVRALLGGHTTWGSWPEVCV